MNLAPPRVLGLFISKAHNFFGHHGLPPGDAPVVECGSIQCIAGRGIEGDRFLDFKPNYKGQITFFAAEVFAELSDHFRLTQISPSVLRRNVFIQGVDLNAWFDTEFEIQGIRFSGAGECAPCYWMNQAIAPGAEDFLKGRGGLRARILSTGTLRLTT
jgi:MOSC domain-containing protein YiiM